MIPVGILAAAQRRSMAPPVSGVVIQSLSRQDFFSASGSRAVAMPAAVTTADMLVVIIHHDSSPVFSGPSGWTKHLTQSDNNGSGYATTVFAKVGSASDSGVTHAFTSSTATSCGVTVIQVRGATALAFAGANWENVSTRSTPVPAGPFAAPAVVITEVHAYYDPSVSNWALPDNQSIRPGWRGANERYIGSTARGEGGLPAISDYVLSRRIYGSHVTIVAT